MDLLLARHAAAIRLPASAEALLAERGGRAVGFALYFTTFSTFLCKPGLYLEDLYVLPSARGRGIGGALIDWLRNAMRAEGWARLYWMTREDNQQARRLYDRFARADGFVRYMIRDR